jgi:quercetin dioxygenase-like cupin family protein
MLTITLVVGVAVGLLGHQVLIAQQAPVTRTILQQKDLEGVAGRELVMFRAELAPGGALGRHSHTGPEMFYVLEGTLTLEPDGQPPVTLKAGDSGYNPAKYIHNAKNPSTAEPTKLIGFWVAEKGQPLATPVK